MIQHRHEQRNRFNRYVLSFALIALSGFASLAEATYTLPASSVVTWQGNVGVAGDIPARTTIYTSLNPSGGNDTTAIQSAINNCPSGQVVKLNAGTFNVGSPITLKSGVTLRGAGMGSTTIKGMSGMSGSYLVGLVNSSFTTGAAVSITGGLSKGSTGITTSASHGWVAGDIILIDQLNSTGTNPPVTSAGNDGTCSWCGRASGTRSLGQVVRITAVPSSTTATLEIPLYWTFNSGLAPQGSRFANVISNAGIENLSIDNISSGSSKQASDGGTILLKGTSNCWVLNVEAKGLWQTMVRIFSAYRTTVRGSKFHTGVSPAGSSQYGVWLNPYNSANLIENNQIYNLTSGIMLNGVASGNVISYNYIANLNDSTIPSWNMSTIGTHGAHPFMNLIEGNYTVGRMRQDNVWGSSSYNTFFRNRQILGPGKTSAAWNIDIQANQRYYNLVGNVLGNVGIENAYQLENMTLSGQKAPFRFGYNSDGDGSATGNDPQVYATVLRHSNWDSYHNATIQNDSPNAGLNSSDDVLAASLYLASKPAWWGSVQWPCIGPDVTPMYPVAPAIGTGTPWSSTKPALSPPTSLRVQ